MILAGVIIYADRAHDSDKRLRNLDLETMQELRQGAAVGGSKFEPGADISTPGRRSPSSRKGWRSSSSPRSPGPSPASARS